MKTGRNQVKVEATVMGTKTEKPANYVREIIYNHIYYQVHVHLDSTPSGFFALA